ncbi:MAG: endopeptidase [Coxiella sp. (in: Bacteria)]|nr:MAG: endopeptidase [Coxiella sp. (in: g-proteobacteria)]
MKLFRRLLSVLFIIPALSLAHVPVTSNGQVIASLAPMLAKVTPTVVNVAVEKVLPPSALNPFAPKSLQSKAPVKALAVGSGVIFDAKHGLIVTNAHVVQNQKLMIVTLKDGRHYRAKLVGKDNGFDIAIIRIDAKNLQALPFGDSDQLKVGNFVAAIGSPFGLTQTVTSGVISALNRSRPQLEGYQSFIQTDAPINPGNSGGALVNMQGQLIGINTAIITPIDANIGIGFSIPSDMVHSVIEQLLKYGKVKRGMLGVIAQDITPELADAMNLKTTKGTLISTVMAGSPAKTAGLLSQDIINKINGKPIRSAAQLRNTLGLMRPGTEIHLSIIRHHDTKEMTATIGDPKKFKPPHVNAFLAGMRLQKFSQLEGDGSRLNGVLVTDLTDTSTGALSGLTFGDVITQADGKPVTSVDTLVHLASKAKNELLIKVYRGTNAVFLVLQP